METGTQGSEELTESEIFLDLIGRGKYKDVVLKARNESLVRGRDFLDHPGCGPYARAAFIAYTAMAEDDPERLVVLMDLQKLTDDIMGSASEAIE